MEQECGKSSCLNLEDKLSVKKARKLDTSLMLLCRTEQTEDWWANTIDVGLALCHRL